MAMELGRLASAAGRPGQCHARRRDLRPGGARRHDRRWSFPRVAGARPKVDVVDLRAELAGGNRGLLSRALTEALEGLDTTITSRRSWSSIGAAARRSSSVVTAATSRSAPSASVRSSSMPTRCRCAAITAARQRPLRGAARRASRCASATWAAARSASSARFRFAFRTCESCAWIAMSSSARARRHASSTPSPRGTSTCWSARPRDQGTRRAPGDGRGVVSADVALNLPDQRAAERTYQLLVQAIGRAGRGERPGPRSSRRTCPITRSSRRSSPTSTRLLRRGARFTPAVQRAALRRRDQADHRARGSGGGREEAAAMADGPARARPPSGGKVEVLGPLPAYIRAAPAAGASTSCCAAREPMDVLGAARARHGRSTSIRSAPVDPGRLSFLYSGANERSPDHHPRRPPAAAQG